MNQQQTDVESAFRRLWPDLVFQWGPRNETLTVIRRQADNGHESRGDPELEDLGAQARQAADEVSRCAALGHVVYASFGAHRWVASWAVTFDTRKSMPMPASPLRPEPSRESRTLSPRRRPTAGRDDGQTNYMGPDGRVVAGAEDFPER